MKRYSILFLLIILSISCSKDEISNDQFHDDNQELIAESRNSDNAGCSITFLGYDDNGCCMYQLNYTSTTKDEVAKFDDTTVGKYKYYVTVDNKPIKGNTFTICDGAWVRLIKESKQTSILVCSSYVECEQLCDIDVTIDESCTVDECCWSISTSGITNHTLILNGDSQVITSDVQLCICAGEGETLEIIILDENGVVCYEETLTCYTCPDCDQNYLSVSLTSLPDENGMECCQVIMKKEGPLYVCDAGGNSTGIYEENGVTVSGIGGSPATISYKICREDWATTNLTGWWDRWDSDGQVCPRMEIDFDLADCN